jgi:hypothetical protein
MPGTDANKKRRRRQKATTEMGRQMMQRERQRLAKEQAELGERLAREALSHREQERPINKPPKQQTSINRSVVRRVAAVLASENVTVPIRCEAAQGSQQMSAWTDFERIAVRYVAHEDVRLLAATLRGLLYHEGGHVRWTVPFVELAGMVGVDARSRDARTMALHTAWNCLEDQRMETAVVSDSPRKAAYFTPLLMTEHCSTLDKMAANWPLLVWRRYLPNKLRQQARSMFVAKHNAMGMDGDALAVELDRIVTAYVMATDAPTMWTSVVEMLAMLQVLHPLASDMADAGHTNQRGRTLPDDFQGLTIPVTPDMIPNDGSVAPDLDMDEDDEPIQMDLSDLEESEVEHVMEVLSRSMLSPETLVEIRYVIEQHEEGDEGGKGAGSLLDKDDDMAAPPAPIHEDDSADEGDEEADDEDAGSDVEEESDDDAGAEGAGADEVDDDAEDGDVDDQDDDADDHGDADEDDDEGHGAGESGTHSSHEADDRFTQEDLDELLQEAEEERYNQGDLDGDMEAFHDANDNGVTDLDVYSGGVETNDALVAAAESLAQDIEDAFHAHTMDRMPAWVEQQRRGVLNVGRYMTRQPGDVEFFRQWTEDDAPGFDIAVSILLDYSGSMSSHVAKLAQCGYAAKLACSKLDIPCTVVLWDTEALTLWDANEMCDTMPTIVANGGTVPDMALADLDNQRCDKAKHLVLIMTDGQWQGRWSGGGGTLAWYKDDGRTIVGFGFGSQGLASSLLAKGCDEAFQIQDLMAIPEYLEGALLDMA